MIKEIFYQSSMPRAGSTLLQNLLHQNPKIHSTPTDGLLELVVGAQANYTNSPEFSAQDAEVMKNAFIKFCRDGMIGYCNSITDREYVINKSRGWGWYRPLLDMIFPEPKIICMVRDLRDIFASMEKIHNSSPDKMSKLINWGEMRGTTLPKRIDIWAQGQPIGLAIDRFKEILQKGYDNKILFIRYEDLCLHPQSSMIKIYDYLGIEFYEHNFDFVEQFTQEDDQKYGANYHTIRNTLQLKQSDARAVLGRDVSEWIYNNYKWYFDYFNYKK